VAVSRPIDIAEAITITEYVNEVPVVLTTAAYRVWPGGRLLERIGGVWGDRVQVAFTPQNDGDARQEVAIRLVQLGISYSGVERERVGEVDRTYADYATERERLLASLSQCRASVA
jgi:hypothetical protein